MFRSFVAICSLVGTIVIASYWLETDKHNDERYAKKTDLADYKIQEARDASHLLEIMNMRFSRIDEKLSDLTDNIKKTNK